MEWSWIVKVLYYSKKQRDNKHRLLGYNVMRGFERSYTWVQSYRNKQAKYMPVANHIRAYVQVMLKMTAPWVLFSCFMTRDFDALNVTNSIYIIPWEHIDYRTILWPKHWMQKSLPNITRTTLFVWLEKNEIDYMNSLRRCNF